MKHSKTRVLSFQKHTHTNHQLRFLHPDSSEKSQNRDGEEDAALDLVMDRLKFYRKEYKRLLKENGELWEENQKIKASYNQLKVSTIFRLRTSEAKLKNDAAQLQNLMKMVTGEMGSALNLMEQAKNEGAEDCL